MSLLYDLLLFTPVWLLFEFLFNALNNSKLHLFVPIQKFTASLKRKNLYYHIFIVIVIFLTVFIKNIIHADHIGNGIILGVLYSLNNIIFDKNFFEPKKLQINDH